MGWYRIAPHYLRQDDPGALTLAFVSHGGLDSGQLTLHLDQDNQVSRFELSHEPFASRGEHYAEWDSREGLRVGEASQPARRDDQAPRMKGSAVVRRYSQPPADVVQDLLAYVAKNGSVLDPQHREAVITALASALPRAGF